MLPRAVPSFEPPHRVLPADAEPPAVAAYRRALPEGRVLAYPLDPLDHLGLPVWSAELFAARAGGHHHGVGYGATDGRAAVGAFGELCEELFAGAAIKTMRRRRASYRDLLSEVGPEGVLDPVTACLPAGSSYTPERHLRWVEARRWATGEPVLVPLELAAASPVDAEPEGEWLVLPVTNGLGAGPTLEHALAHGLLELVQRDGNSATYRALDRGVRVALDDVRSAETRALLDRLDQQGVEVVVKLASTDFGLANLYVVGAEREPEKTPHPLALTAGGEAAHPDREAALGKALIEFCASRSRKIFANGPLAAMAAVAPGAYVGRALRSATREHEEERSLRESVDWLGLGAGEMRDLLEDPVLAVRSEVEFSSLPERRGVPVGSAADLVAGRLLEAGFDVLFVDFSPPAGDISVVKAIAPGLEVETASYGRIGARNLRRLLDRDDGLAGTGASPPGGRNVLLPENERESFPGDPWLDVEALDEKVGRLYPLYREPSRHLAALVADGVL